MSKYSPKQTNGKWLSRDASGRFVPLHHGGKTAVSVRSQYVVKSDSWRNPKSTQTIVINKFEGMAEAVEVFEAVHIPGYKVRG